VLGEAALSDGVLRLYRTPGPPGAEPLSLALVSPLPTWLDETRARGQRLVSLAYPRRVAPWLLPGTKCVSYATHAAATAEARRRRDADDAVFVDLDDTVLEGTVTNVWWREGSTLLTPALELGILAGETRAALLELAPAAGYEVEEGVFPVGRLRQADEIFTSSSVREVMPVVALDGEPVSRGPAAETRSRPRSVVSRRGPEASRAWAATLPPWRSFAWAAWRSRTASSCTARTSGARASGWRTAR
jgi:branched-subunit amino acid aminotransferase/4-amino-4-deoxychorismate lyase